MPRQAPRLFPDGCVSKTLSEERPYHEGHNCKSAVRQKGRKIILRDHTEYTRIDRQLTGTNHIIEALRQDALVLRFLERNFVWPGLDQIEASREAEPLMRKLLAIVLSSPEMAGRSEREVYQRITALGSMCMSVCYSSILEGKPDNIDAMKPVLYDIIRRALSPEK